MKIEIFKQIKSTVLIISLFSLLTVNGYGQDYSIKLSILSQQNDELLSKSMPLVDNNGFLVGYAEMLYKDKNPSLKIHYKEMLINIDDPLTHLIICPEANRLFMFGEPISVHKVFNIALRIYDLSGVLINKKDSLGHFPFTVKVSDNGNFYIGSNDNYLTENASYSLKCIDDNGVIKWTRMINDQIPCLIESNNKNSKIALATKNQNNSEMNIQLYSSNGNKISNIGAFSTISSLSFANNILVITALDGWFIYNIEKVPFMENKGNYMGNIIGEYPLTVFEIPNAFILTSADEKGYYLNIIELASGLLLNNTFFKGNPYWRGYRLIEPDKNRFFFNKDDQKLEIEIIK